jgi:DUF2911 family protein
MIMRRSMTLLVLLIVLPLFATAQEKPDSTKTATALCTFQDGNQISVRYPALPVPKQGLRSGEVWPPSSSPIFLFTSAELMAGNAALPRGAFSMYLIPEKQKWTLIINKTVSNGTPYQPQQDVTRQPMEIGQLPEPQPFEIAFAQVGPKQCNVRIYYGKTGAWGAEFKEK